MTLETGFAPPSGIARLLQGACYDCHSQETRWPWYSRISPISWLVAHDVSGGRGQVNFSTIGREAPEDQAFYLEACARKVRAGEMPLKRYAWLHGEARLSDAERERLGAWFVEAARRGR